MAAETKEIDAVASSTPKRVKETSCQVKAEKSWADLCVGSEENSVDGEEMARHEIKIELFDANNGMKFDKLIKGERIKSPFKIADVKVADTLVPHDPGILDFKLAELKSPEVKLLQQDPSIIGCKVADTPSSSSAVADQSMEDGELEATMAETSFKRKMPDPPVNGNAVPHSKKHRADSCSSSSSGGSSVFPKQKLETDQETLERRQKQIDFGKNTIGYENYLRQVPKATRRKDQPRTPPMHLKYSRRAWDGMVRKWRRDLHEWDPQGVHNDTIEDGELRNGTAVEEFY